MEVEGHFFSVGQEIKNAVTVSDESWKSSENFSVQGFSCFFFSADPVKTIDSLFFSLVLFFIWVG